MDALKYGSYMSGLYGSMSTSSTTSTDPKITTSNSNVGGNKSPYSQQHEMSPKSYDINKSYDTGSNNGQSSVSASISGSGDPTLKGIYTADSLSRSYFDASRYVQDVKSYTPDSMATSGGRASADSPDPIRQIEMQQVQQQQQQTQQQVVSIISFRSEFSLMSS